MPSESSADDLAVGQRRIRILHEGGVEALPAALADRKEPNLIRTTRFTWLSWLPKSLFWQFRRIANVYFLLIAVLVCFPSISTKKWQSKVFPFAGVILWTALKDLYEDSNRRRDDRKENERRSYWYSWATKAFVHRTWKLMGVGHLVLIEKDEPFPADLVAVASSDPQGTCFISTASLDGEANLKERQAVRATQAVGPAGAIPAGIPMALASMGLEITLGAPSPALGEANGCLSMQGQNWGVGIDNLLPRGCILRNTAWVIGIVAYAGDDTKVRLNAAPAPTKVSDVQGYLSLCVLGLLACLCITCMAFAAAGVMSGNEDPLILTFLRYLITLYHVVPISLYVCFEVLKLVLARQINMDSMMIDEATGQGAQSRTSDLVEEMGQVGFIFSDKTGTLTANEMRFAYGFVDGEIMGPFLHSSKLEHNAAVREASRAICQGASSGKASPVGKFFELLAVCHTVQLDTEGEYQAASPDEVALVSAARDVGLVFDGRETVGGAARLLVKGPNEGLQTSYLVAHVLEFDADRKRMSVICPEDDGTATVYTKGADSIVAALLEEPMQQAAQAALGHFAMQGLRTLVLASRRMSAEEYAEWREDWEAAGRALEGRKSLVDQVAAKAEQRLSFIGISAVEDRLQDGVPETVTALRRDAGLRVWLLTGDKVETAVEIAKSVGLFDATMTLHDLVGHQTSESACVALEDAKWMKARHSGIILDGQTVRVVLESPSAKRALYELGLASQTCVCCRLSPAQKKALVQLVREQDPTVVTLAIGDGANDVPMIQGAHIGIGIRGKEGMGAVQASDLAISQFRFLGNLLFVHGRRAYHHVTVFLCYYLYKNVVLAWGDIINAVDIGFTGEIAYPDWLSSAFNALFTSWPILLVLATDWDMPPASALASPHLFRFGVERRGFNGAVFGRWMALAALHGVLAWAVPAYFLGADAADREARSEEFWRSSAAAFTVVIEVITLKLFLVASKPISAVGLCACVMSVIVYFATLFALGALPSMQPELEGIPGQIFTQGKTLLCVLILPGLALLPDFTIATWERLGERHQEKTMEEKTMEGPPC